MGDKGVCVELFGGETNVGLPGGVLMVLIAILMGPFVSVPFAVVILNVAVNVPFEFMLTVGFSVFELVGETPAPEKDQLYVVVGDVLRLVFVNAIVFEEVQILRLEELGEKSAIGAQPHAGESFNVFRLILPSSGSMTTNILSL